MSSTLTNLLYHIVFSTKNREPIVTKPIRAELYKYIGGIIRGEGGTLLEIGGMPDHVHLVVRFKAEAVGRDDGEDYQIEIVEVAERAAEAAGAI